MNKINIENWGTFKVGDLFNLVHSKAYHMKDVIESNDGIAYITRSKFDNGLKYRVYKRDDFQVNPSNTISFGAENANFFYQPEEYITGNKMYYVDTRNLSIYACLFIKTVLEKTFTDSYSFSDGMIPKKIKNESIQLPQDNQGNPDWEWMEEYMKNLFINRKVKKRIKLF